MTPAIIGYIGAGQEQELQLSRWATYYYFRDTKGVPIGNPFFMKSSSVHLPRLKTIFPIFIMYRSVAHSCDLEHKNERIMNGQ